MPLLFPFVVDVLVLGRLTLAAAHTQHTTRTAPRTAPATFPHTQHTLTQYSPLTVHLPTWIDSGTRTNTWNTPLSPPSPPPTKRYDFGYLLKLLTCTPLPAEEAAFFELLHTYFPCIYDEKHMMRDCGDGIKGGLNYLADQIQVRRL